MDRQVLTPPPFPAPALKLPSTRAFAPDSSSDVAPLAVVIGESGASKILNRTSSFDSGGSWTAHPDPHGSDGVFKSKTDPRNDEDTHAPAGGVGGINVDADEDDPEEEENNVVDRTGVGICAYSWVGGGWEKRAGSGTSGGGSVVCKRPTLISVLHTSWTMTRLSWGPPRRPSRWQFTVLPDLPGCMRVVAFAFVVLVVRSCGSSGR